MSVFTCPVCSSKVNLSTRMEYAFCPVCTERISTARIKNTVPGNDLIHASPEKEAKAAFAREKPKTAYDHEKNEEAVRQYQPNSEPYRPRYIPPVEESSEERNWVMGCGICGSFCGTSYNS